MKEKIKNLSRKEKIIILTVSVIVLLVMAALILFLVMGSKGKDNPFGQMNMPPGMENMGENVISAGGLTAVGMSEESLKLDFLETKLYVEESFLATGDEVEAGTVIFTISDETLKEAKKELEDAVTEAQLAYRQGVIDYETSFLEAKAAYETSAVNQQYAQAEYDSSVSTAKDTVESLTKQVEEARELAEEYEKSVNEDYYRSYYEVDELFSTYYEHFTLLMEKYEEWDIETLEEEFGGSGSSLSLSSLTGYSSASSGTGTMGSMTASGSSSQETEIPQGSGMQSGAFMEYSAVDEENQEEPTPTASSSPEDPTPTPSSSPEDPTPMPSSSPGSPSFPGGGGSMPSGGDMGQMAGMDGMSGMQNMGSGEEQQKLSVYNLLDELVQRDKANYETAVENYENAKARAKAGLKGAQSNLAMLEAELNEAQTAYEKALITCKADYQTMLAEGENAQIVYDTTCQSLEETLAALQTDKEEAEENLAYFEEKLGEGSFYTTKAGTIVVNAVREDSYLSGDTMVIAYSNPETVTISASVDQSNIADIEIGDEALVVISEYGNYKGMVTTINPVTQASSRSSVTYQVTVTLEGDISGLESNLTAYVYFGVDNVDSMLKAGEESAPGGAEGNMPENREGKEAGNERAMEER